MKARIIIVAGPSGSGKSSFVERICKEDLRLMDLITFTTRAMREGESEGSPYHFVSEEKFLELKSKGFFLETARVHNYFYGSPLYQFEESWKAKKCIIMDIDIQGAQAVKSKYPDSHSIFILPPSLEELRRRVISRDGQGIKDLEIRMETAKKEMQFADLFDYQTVNDDLELSYQRFKKIVLELLDD